MNIREAYRLREYTGKVGVEIEVEGNKLIKQIDGWNCLHDGSLQGEAMEYVTTDTNTATQACIQVKKLYMAMRKANTNIHDSVRAGVHIHLNMQNKTHTEVFTFATLWYVFEPLLLKFCGDSRDGNLFCLKSDDAQYIQWMINNAVEGHNLRNLNDDGIRYSALNWKPLLTFGSLEFRCMRTPTDFKHIVKWIRLLEALLKTSEQYNNPQEIIADYSMNTAIDFVKKHFGDLSKYLVVDNIEELVQQGMYNAQDLAFSPLKTWEDFEKEMEVRGERNIKAIKEHELHRAKENEVIGLEHARIMRHAKARKAKQVIIIEDEPVKVPEEWGANPFEVNNVGVAKAPIFDGDLDNL